MSGNPGALREAMANMAHGAGMAVLGIPTDDVPIDFNQVIFKMLTVRGIYGREMFETWYAMSVLVSQGLDITPTITHRFSASEYEEAFATARGGRCGKVLPNWAQ
jgi:threonine 3-dehydrogenase